MTTQLKLGDTVKITHPRVDNDGQPFEVLQIKDGPNGPVAAIRNAAGFALRVEARHLEVIAPVQWRAPNWLMRILRGAPS